MPAYRKIPFVNSRRGLGDYEAPGEIVDVLWTGLKPGVASRAYMLAGDRLDADDLPPGMVAPLRIGAYNYTPGNAPSIANNRRSYKFYSRMPEDRSPGDVNMGAITGQSFRAVNRDQSRSVEDAGGVGRLFSPINPNSGFLGAADTVIVRPPKNAVPGWAGFFGWVAATHPKLYNMLRVSLPDYVGDIETLRSGAMSLGAIGDDNPDGTVPVIPSYVSPGFVPTTTLNLTRFPSTNDGEGITSGAPTKTFDTTNQLVSTISSIGAGVLNLVQDQKLFNLNLQRAAQGKPPINAAAYMNANSGINVGLNAGTQSTLLLLAAGIGGVFLLSKAMKRR